MTKEEARAISALCTALGVSLDDHPRVQKLVANARAQTPITMSVTCAAKRLGVGRSTIYDWIDRGIITPCLLGADQEYEGITRIPEKEIERCVRDGQRSFRQKKAQA